MLCVLICASGFPVMAEYLNHQELTDKLKSFEKTHASLVHLESIGNTKQERNIWTLRIGNEKKGDPDGRSALFLCGNIDGDHHAGCAAVVATIGHILENYGKDERITDLVDNHTCYFVPSANPDAAEFLFKKILTQRKCNMNPIDDDVDGLLDEDPPEDLNADGLITQMRVRHPDGMYIVDPDHPDLLKKADPNKGETGLYKLISEGIDNDRDGAFNEDPIGGVNVNRNFPHKYPYHQTGAGRYMTSETETRALIEFLLAHKNIVAMIAYGMHDNLIQPPKPGRAQPSRQVPEQTGTGRRFRRSRQPETSVNANDIPLFEAISDRYKKSTGFESNTNEMDEPRGSLYEWGYFQYGVLSFSTPVWHPPAKAKSDSSQPRRRRPMTGRQQEGASNDVRWLEWIREERSGAGFVEWQAYDHPDLGEIEIGGFAPYVRTNPPEDLLPELLDKHVKFFISLADIFPNLKLHPIGVEKKADGVYHLEATIENTGFLPTALAHGALARAVKPILIKLEGKAFEILTGRPLQIVDALSGKGGMKRVSWLVKAERGSRLQLTVSSEKAGSLSETITLQ